MMNPEAAYESAAEEFAAQGFYVARELFSSSECDALTEHFMELRKTERPGDFAGVDLTSEDPLKRFPRMIHMHRWDEVSLRWAVDPRLNELMTAMLGREPYMVQTMLYYKPAGGRGQALHQDNSYLRTVPGTCIAAWLALDDCDEENGCLQVVPGTHSLPLLCTVKADTTQSFTDVTVKLPPEFRPDPVVMRRGDVLFFNGSLVHGSFPNRSADRFRRSLIGHYLTGEAEKVGQFYHPVYRMDGTAVEFGVSPGATRCGHWVDVDGNRVVEMVDVADQNAEERHE